MKRSKMPKRKWTAGRGTLLVIAFLFGASAILRIGFGTGEALAKEVAAFNPDTSSDHTQSLCENPEDVKALLADLSAQKSSLDSRERKLQELQVTLEISEAQIRKNLTVLITAEEKLSATIANSETAAENDLARLTSVYENMKAKQASVLFEEMSPEFAAGFVGRMRPDAAAEIMAGLSPRLAYSISVILAGRNALAPTD